MRNLLHILALMALTAALLGVVAPGCERYEPPPTVSIEGLQGGLLFDSRAPLLLSFGQPIDVASLRLKVAYADTDLEGDLPDEDSDPDNDDALRVLLSHDALDGTRGGRLEVDPDRSRVRFVPDAALPVGPKLVLLVEGGLQGGAGRVRTDRTRITFSYAVRCKEGVRADRFQNGVYFVLLEVAQPVGTQIQLYGAIEVDPATGAFSAQMTNADRNPDNARCLGGCAPADRCRLLPTPRCVPPSDRAGTANEYPDFVPNAEPPTGYSFAIAGCASDDGAGVGVLTAPATMVVQSPQVTVEGLTMTAYFSAEAAGDVRATGSLTADTIYLGTAKLPAGKGTMTAKLIPEDEIPANVPRPVRPALDAGTRGAPDAGR